MRKLYVREQIEETREVIHVSDEAFKPLLAAMIDFGTDGIDHGDDDDDDD